MIVLSVQADKPGQFETLTVGSHPSNLSGKSGVALGHPDLKEDFAIRVTFPKDDLYSAKQWSIGRGSIVGRRSFIFEPSDLDLLVIDGTINEGMSGGPVIFDGRVIGVVSGSEERTGAGLGWAIPAEYLGTLSIALQGQTVQALPPLKMLSPTSAPLVPLKQTETRAGSEVFESLLEQKSLSQAVGSIRERARQSQAILEECLPLFLRADPSLAHELPNCLGTAMRVPELLPEAVDLYKELAELVEDFEGNAELFWKRMAMPTMLDMKAGLFRKAMSFRVPSVDKLHDSSRFLAEAEQALLDLSEGLVWAGELVMDDDPNQLHGLLSELSIKLIGPNVEGIGCCNCWRRSMSISRTCSWRLRNLLSSLSFRLMRRRLKCR